jgi:hypothetical protein
MKLLEEATIADAQKMPIQASLKYEALIQNGQANLDSYINLAVLYFVCLDFGYETTSKLPEDFVLKASSRVFEVLEIARIKFGNSEEIDFWGIYFRFILNGEEPMYENCALLAQIGKTLIPYFHLYAKPDGEKYRIWAEKLFDAVKDGENEKNRYIKSILQNTMKMRDFGKIT